MKIGVLRRLHVATYTCLYILVHSKINLLVFLIGLKNWFEIVEATKAQYCLIVQVIIIDSKISFVLKVLIVSKLIVWNITDVRYDYVRKSLCHCFKFCSLCKVIHIKSYSPNLHKALRIINRFQWAFMPNKEKCWLL